MMMAEFRAGHVAWLCRCEAGSEAKRSRKCERMYADRHHYEQRLSSSTIP